MARALGQMEKQEGQGLGLEKGWGGASVSPPTLPRLPLLVPFISASPSQELCLQTLHPTPQPHLFTFFSSSSSFKPQ